MTLKAQVQTPMSKDDPTVVKAEEIPLPPPEMWGELDNAGKIPPEAPAKTLAAPAPAKERPEGQILRFTAGTRKKVVPLQFSFELGGEEILEVHVQRLTLADVDQLLASLDKISTFDIYSVMTGLPPAVLRGLDDDDAVAVTEACYAFLPRRLRPASEQSGTSANGEATSLTSQPT
ncbi:phage tail assembly protein [Neorhizobium sp. T786]|uniref:phage tail assembly protein n=1 Tax=Pseudorhizobium xiangyangii TaxID=2883104 RepID=UPI001CFF59AA|nr:phage tail assembly protein [Neorhizobium xiangyangii]MCB5203953.1 phage tail assembly protein [Neorhizobium xiangyangii]